MLRLQKNEKIKLNIPEFLCDVNAVGEHLEKHPLTAQLNTYGFTCVIGLPQSGKTSFTIAIMTQSKPKIFKKTHHHIIILMPTNSIKSLKINPFKQLKEENFYNELTDETITEIFKNIESYTEKGEKTLLLIDDMTASLKSSRYVESTLKKMIFNRRHLKLNIIITCQSFVNMPLDIRKTITNLILFKPSKMEFEKVFIELIETNKHLFEKIFKIAYKNNNHNFLFVNIPSQRFFVNFDELIITEDDETDDEK